MTVSSIGTAVSEIVTQFTAVWGVNNAKLPGKEFATEDASVKWCQFELDHASSRQATLAGEGGLKRWQREGVCAIYVYFPRKDLNVRSAYDEVETYAMLYQGKRTASDIWFRNVNVAEGSSTTWFCLVVNFDFEYQQLS